MIGVVTVLPSRGAPLVVRASGNFYPQRAVSWRNVSSFGPDTQVHALLFPAQSSVLGKSSCIPSALQRSVGTLTVAVEE